LYTTYFSQGEKLANRSADVSTVAAILKSQSAVMLDQLKEVGADVENVLNGLNHYSGSSSHVSDSAALMEARRLLEKISTK